MIKYLKNRFGHAIQLSIGNGKTVCLLGGQSIQYSNLVVEDTTSADYNKNLFDSYLSEDILTLIVDMPITAKVPTSDLASISNPIIVNFSPSIPTKCIVGTSSAIIQLSDLSTGISSNGNNTYSWHITPNTFSYVSGNASSASPKIQLTSAGTYSITETVTNNDLNISGNLTQDNLMIAINPTIPISISISPSTVSLTAGGTQQFTATIIGSGSHSVTWSSTGYGGVDQNGLYTSVASGTDTVTVTSIQDPTKLATATITVNAIIH